MKDKIYNYSLGTNLGVIELDVPAPAIFLGCALQFNRIRVWMQANPKRGEKTFKRRFVLTMTGSEVPDGQSEFCGVFVIGDKAFQVWRLLD
jgi:hypothetical protein